MVDYLTEELRKNVPNIHLATNPCRIQYCTQEIVVIREDLVTKMCRNCIHFPTVDNLPLHVSVMIKLFNNVCVCSIYIHTSEFGIFDQYNKNLNSFMIHTPFYFVLFIIILLYD